MATARFGEHFDDVKAVGAGGADMGFVWDDFDTGGVIGPEHIETGGRYNGGRLKLNRNGWVRTDFLGSQTKVVYGAAVQRAGAWEDVRIFRMQDVGGNDIASLWVTALGAWRLKDDTGATIATSAETMTILAWHWVEWEHDTASQTFELRLDRGAGQTTTIIDVTSFSTTTVVQRLRIHGASGSGNSMNLDDLHILDTTGDSGDNFLGDGRMIALRPTSDVTSDWTPSTGSDNFALVDETPLDESDYNEASVDAKVDLYEFGNMSPEFTQFDFVMANVHAKKTDGSGTRLFVDIVSNSVKLQSGLHTLLTNGRYNKLYALVNPDGGGAWTLSTVNAAQAGFELDV